MSYADKVFKENVKDILENGVWDTDMEVRPRWLDGTPAHTVKKFCIVNRYDLSKEFPIMTIRKQGFKNAIAGADRAIVVTTPEVSAVRDADRIIGLLEANELRNPTLILNRLRIDLVQRGEMMNIEDVEEILAIDILGVVPDDESIVIATNKGEPAVMNENSKAGQAYRNIVQRLLGNDVPLMSFEPEPETFMDKLKKLFRK